MKRYIPTNTPIHAIKVEDTKQCVAELQSRLKNVEFYRDQNQRWATYLIYHTVHGNKLAMDGDYICQDLQSGQYYTVSGKMFEKMYKVRKNPILKWLEQTHMEFQELTRWQKIAVLAIILTCLLTLALILNLSKDLLNINLARDLLEDCRFTPEEQLQWNKF